MGNKPWWIKRVAPMKNSSIVGCFGIVKAFVICYKILYFRVVSLYTIRRQCVKISCIYYVCLKPIAFHCVEWKNIRRNYKCLQYWPCKIAICFFIATWLALFIALKFLSSLSHTFCKEIGGQHQVKKTRKSLVWSVISYN